MVVTSVAPAGVQWFMPSLLVNGFCHVSLLRPAQRWLLNSEGSLVGPTSQIRLWDRLIASYADGAITLRLLMQLE